MTGASTSGSGAVVCWAGASNRKQSLSSTTVSPRNLNFNFYLRTGTNSVSTVHHSISLCSCLSVSFSCFLPLMFSYRWRFPTFGVSYCWRFPPSEVFYRWRFPTVGVSHRCIEPLMDQFLHRLPSLEHAEIRQLTNGPESFTPDGYSILGPAPEASTDRPILIHTIRQATKYTVFIGGGGLYRGQYFWPVPRSNYMTKYRPTSCNILQQLSLRRQP